MNRFLLFVFVVVPFVEIWLLIWVGRSIGAGNVVLSLLASAFFGIYMIRHEGMRTLGAIQDRLGRKEIPGDELLDGAMLLLAGVLFIVPGYLSDLAGFILVFPWTRIPLRNAFLSLLQERMRAAAFHGDPSSMVIEGETLRRHDDDY
ncbi:MAG: FxsA family protein [Magnetococcales bacterium]|nr:FxsA family protein [Magnetococcales bacterium]